MKPWEGCEFGRPGSAFRGVRFVVVGESAHSMESGIGSKPEDYLTETVENFLDGKKYAFHSKLTTLLSGKSSINEVTREERRRIWNGLSFFNYVQAIAAKAGRDPVSKEVKRESFPGFEVVLKKLEPDAVLVCGKDASGWIARGLGYERAWELGHYQFHGVPVARVRHPTGGFSYARWRPVVDQLFHRADRHPLHTSQGSAKS